MNRFSVRVRVAAAAALLLMGVGSACALPVTWVLQNVTFDDGGTANGQFVYDAATNTVSAWSVAVAGGNTGTFPPITYDPINSTSYFSTFLGPNFELIGSFRQFRLTTVTLLDDGGGTLPVATGISGGAECFNCSPYRVLAGGELIGTAVTSAPAAEFTVGSAGSFGITTLGLPGSTLTITGVLPANVTFADNGDGTATLAGTPAADTLGDYPLTITVGIPQVGAGAQQAFHLSVKAAPMAPSMPVPTLGVFGLLASILGLLAVAWRQMRRLT